jgi:hypothetical protein
MQNFNKKEIAIKILKDLLPLAFDKDFAFRGNFLKFLWDFQGNNLDLNKADEL